MDDSYQGIVADISKLQDKKRIYSVHNNDMRTNVLYARCPPPPPRPPLLLPLCPLAPSHLLNAGFCNV